MHAEYVDVSLETYGLLHLPNLISKVEPQLYIHPHTFLFHVLLFAKPKRSHFIHPNTCFNDLVQTVFVGVKNALINLDVRVDHPSFWKNGKLETEFKTYYRAFFSEAIGQFINTDGRLLYQFQLLIIFKNRKFHHCFPYGEENKIVNCIVKFLYPNCSIVMDMIYSNLFIFLSTGEGFEHRVYARNDPNSGVPYPQGPDYNM